MEAPSITAGEASKRYNARLVGDPDFLIQGVADPNTAKSHSLCFVASPSYLQSIKKSPALCWVLDPKLFDSLDEEVKKEKVFLLTEKPYHFFVEVVSVFHPQKVPKPQRHENAAVDPTAQVDSSAHVDAFVSVGAYARVGRQVVLHPGVWVGEGAEIGDGTVLYSGVKVYPRCIVGKRNIIHAGAVIGSDGFGFLPGGKGLVKIPQVGRVVVHDDVEIGANTTIDRGTLDDTVIGRGTKIDNHVQIGHNCRVGENVVLCGFVGLSGNTVVGNNVVMGGQAGTKGHIKIGDNVQVAAQSGVSKDIPPGIAVKGYPAMPLQEFLKIQTLFLKLPEIYKRLLALEKK